MKVKHWHFSMVLHLHTLIAHSHVCAHVCEDVGLV